MRVNSELKEAQFEITETDKAHSVNRKGLVWFNRATDKIKAIFNSEVKTIATEDWVDTRLGSDIAASEQGLVANGLLTDEQASKPSAPDTDKRKLYAKADGIYELGNDDNEHRLARIEDVDNVQNQFILKGYTQIPCNETTVTDVLYTTSGNCLIFLSPDSSNRIGEIVTQINNNTRYRYTGVFSSVHSGQKISVTAPGSNTGGYGILHIFNF